MFLARYSTKETWLFGRLHLTWPLATQAIHLWRSGYQSSYGLPDQECSRYITIVLLSIQRISHANLQLIQDIMLGSRRDILVTQGFLCLA